MKPNPIRAGFLAALALATAAVHAQNIKVSVDGQPVEFRGQDPTYTNGRVLVPLRGVFEELGATVQWNPAGRMVIATSPGTDIRLRIGDRRARVNGEWQELDVPARIVNGSTMVPLRFLSEALGADVNWNAYDSHVIITTTSANRSTVANQRTDSNRVAANRTRVTMFERGMVIPVRLNSTLSSNGSRRGDRFSTTVRTSGNDSEYHGLPNGTRLEGRVVTARARRGDEPGVLELEFDRIRLPDGTTHTIDGALVSLDSKYVAENDNGVLVARNREDRMVYTGVGAGAGLIVGILTKKPLEGALLGGLLGYLYGENKSRNASPSDVSLKPGTEFGVRMERDVEVWR